MCLRVSVPTFSATRRNEAAKKPMPTGWALHIGLILKLTIFVKILRSRVMA